MSRLSTSAGGSALELLRFLVRCGFASGTPAAVCHEHQVRLDPCSATRSHARMRVKIRRRPSASTIPRPSRQRLDGLQGRMESFAFEAGRHHIRAAQAAGQGGGAPRAAAVVCLDHHSHWSLARDQDGRMPRWRATPGGRVLPRLVLCQPVLSDWSPGRTRRQLTMPERRGDCPRSRCSSTLRPKYGTFGDGDTRAFVAPAFLRRPAGLPPSTTSRHRWRAERLGVVRGRFHRGPRRAIPPQRLRCVNNVVRRDGQRGRRSS
jgi:hypothetical protein